MAISHCHSLDLNLSYSCHGYRTDTFPWELWVGKVVNNQIAAVTTSIYFDTPYFCYYLVPRDCKSKSSFRRLLCVKYLNVTTSKTLCLSASVVTLYLIITKNNNWNLIKAIYRISILFVDVDFIRLNTIKADSLFLL